MSNSVAPLTDRVYRSSWGLFCNWCRESGRSPLPATSEALSLYVAWAVREAGYRLASVRAHVCAIRFRHRVDGHPNPVDDSVRELIGGLSRQLKERPRGRAALTPGQLVRLSRMLAADGSVIALRDRAALVLGFALGWRGSETARLRVDDVVFVRRRGLRVFQGWSKTDQEGKGREVGIPAGDFLDTCPVRTLRAWLAVRGSSPGPLFCRVRKSGVVLPDCCVTGQAICDMLKARMVEAGMRPANYGSHSLRAGCVTAAAEAGATETAIMHRTGHRSFEMVQRYTRPARAFSVDPLRGVL